MRKWISKCGKMMVCLLIVCVFSQLGGTTMTAQAAEGTAYPFQVWVNRAQNCATIYAVDEIGNYTVPIKAMLCSVGTNPENTPLGTFSTSNYYDWRLMVDGSYAQYAIRINGPIMLHSVPYFAKAKDRLETDQFNKLGENASLGCIRFAASDIEWIYKNCPRGTQVVVYEDFETPGPLGKPEQMKIEEEHSFAGWDPTDTDMNNPWKTVLPVMYAKIDPTQDVLYIPAGSTQESIKSMVGLIDYTATEVAVTEDMVSLNGTYNVNMGGLYPVWVQVKDGTGMMVEKAMTFAVIG